MNGGFFVLYSELWGAFLAPCGAGLQFVDYTGSKYGAWLFTSEQQATKTALLLQNIDPTLTVQNYRYGDWNEGAAEC